MKVGDYVRTRDGYIAKYIKKDIHYQFDNTIMDYNITGVSKTILDEIVIKSSPNIIDLIEVGDMVKVEDFGWVRVSIKFETLKFFDADGTEWLYDEIESIVTKEQMKAMKYKIGE